MIKNYGKLYLFIFSRYQELWRHDITQFKAGRKVCRLCRLLVTYMFTILEELKKRNLSKINILIKVKVLLASCVYKGLQTYTRTYMHACIHTHKRIQKYSVELLVVHTRELLRIGLCTAIHVCK
jgi:hypothetical protein